MKFTRFIIKPRHAGGCFKRFCMALLSFVFLNGFGYAQSTPQEFTLDTALVKVKYERILNIDTLKSDMIKKEYLTLQAGLKASIFFSAKRREENKLMFSNFDYCLDVFRNQAKLGEIAVLERDVIFRRYELNQTITHQRFDMTHWIIYEPLEKPVWTIGQESDTVLGFTCIKATASFRGREWTAYFAPEIPIGEGPWKLFGLPGLILKAYDSKHHYEYEAKEIDTSSAGLVEYFNDFDRLELHDRRKALKLHKESLGKDIRGMMISAYGLKLDKPLKQDDTPVNYDFEETDYPHE